MLSNWDEGGSDRIVEVEGRLNIFGDRPHSVIASSHQHILHITKHLYNGQEGKKRKEKG